MLSPTSIRLIHATLSHRVTRRPRVLRRTMTAQVSTLTGVPASSQMIAAMRAAETEFPPAIRRINDPYARLLADETGFRLMYGLDKAIAIEAMAWKDKLDRCADTVAQRNGLAVRSANFDIALKTALRRVPSAKQIVTLGSGMDTRAYRLDIPRSITMYEIDYAHVHQYKTQKLRLAHAEPTCKLVTVAADMAVEDWEKKLLHAGFDKESPTVWVAEGLLYYIPKPGLMDLIARVDSLSLPKSRFIFDSFEDHEALLDAVPAVKDYLHANGIIWYARTSDMTPPLAAGGWKKEAWQSALWADEYVWKKY
jgi:methyltransferase (TIGR00027 family)